MPHQTSPASILVVDDNEANRDLLARRLKQQGYQIVTANDGQQALDTLQNKATDLVLLDIMMPNVNGYQVLEQMKASPQLLHIPVIIISAIDEMDSIVRCIEMGADDYLSKPFNPVLLRARVTSSLERKRMHDIEEGYRRQLEDYNDRLEDRVREQVSEIAAAQLSTIFAMSKLAESKDPDTGAHLDRMREYCQILAQHLATLPAYNKVITRDFIDCIYAASPLHDIGKVGIPDHILLKTGSLTAEEWAIMKQHPLLGADTLRAVHDKHPNNSFIQMGIEIAQHHHEKWDGSGYPQGLHGPQIPLAARILSLADVYDALTTERCYKKAFDHPQSRHLILEGRGRHFDPDVVDAFISTEQQFISIKDTYHDPATAGSS